MEAELPRSFEELGRRLGFTDEQLRIKHGHPDFFTTFGRSILYAAERSPSFYRDARIRAATQEQLS